MSEVIKITDDQGEELLETEYGSSAEIDGHTYDYFDIQYDVEDHRWNTTHLYIFKRDDEKLFGMKYDVGLTENQENGFVYNNPQLYEVNQKIETITKVSYSKVIE